MARYEKDDPEKYEASHVVRFGAPFKKNIGCIKQHHHRPELRILRTSLIEDHPIAGLKGVG